MKDIIIYTKKGCPYCSRAKALLDFKVLAYKEIEVGNNPDKRAELTKKANGSTTVPQIFIDGRHIGGCDDLFSLDNGKKLDDLLK
jgi:glutaredoxin 3